MQPYIVYVKADDQNRITAINSSAFIPDPSGWIEIDSGFGVKYHHAQGNYFDQPLYDDRDIKRYQAYPFVDAPAGKVVARFFKDGKEYLILERTQEERDADWIEPAPKPAPDNRIDALEKQLAAYEAAYLEGVNEA